MGSLQPKHSPNLTLTRYVVAVLAVYVDDSADKDELQQIVAAAELLGVPVESAPNLERRLSLELAQRTLTSENAFGSGDGVALRSSMLTTPPASLAPASRKNDAAARRWRRTVDLLHALHVLHALS